VAYADLAAMIDRHEGIRLQPYCDRCGTTLHRSSLQFGEWACAFGCPGGAITIGPGIEILPGGITLAEASVLRDLRIAAARVRLDAYDWFAFLDPVRQDAIIDMAYTMGVRGVRDFVRMLSHLLAKDWPAAASEIQLSDWSKEAPARALEIATMIETGRYAAAK